MTLIDQRFSFLHLTQAHNGYQCIWLCKERIKINSGLQTKAVKASWKMFAWYKASILDCQTFPVTLDVTVHLTYIPT